MVFIELLIILTICQLIQRYMEFLNFNNKGSYEHIANSSISISYSLIFSSNNFNFYDEVQIDTLGNLQQYY